MKTVVNISIILVLIACSSKKAVTAKAEPAEKKMEEKIVKKQAVKQIKGYTYEKSIRTFFHNSVSQNKRKQVRSTLKKGKRVSDKKSRYKQQIKLIEASKRDPLWFEYFDEKIQGSMQLHVRVSSKGFADIITIERGIRPDVDLIACDYVSRYKFTPAVGKKSGKKVSSWIRISNQF